MITVSFPSYFISFYLLLHVDIGDGMDYQKPFQSLQETLLVTHFLINHPIHQDSIDSIRIAV